jgi:DNA ligase (NAD+)
MNVIADKIGKYSKAKLTEYLSKTDLDTLHKLKLYVDDLYYNTDKDSGLSDWQYDLLKEVLVQRDPDYKVPVGTRIREGENRVELPFWLGSMNKIKQSGEDELNKWLGENPATEYSIEAKLDGVSCLLVYKSGKIKLYTRGDGEVGADISYLAQYFSSIPKLKTDITVRGELIMKRETFDEKYSKKYKNPRNLVAGRTGGKKIREGLEDIDFVAYEIVDDGVMEPPSIQLGKLAKLGFNTVYSELLPEIDIDILSATFLKLKSSSPYDVDGLIVQTNTEYVRNVAGNPEYAFAYKMIIDENVVDVVVVGVDWNVSKWGQLKPRVEYEPTEIGGTTNTWATGFNARFINDNMIGPGAIIRITRSGDTIPYIIEVVHSADQPDMPEIPYQWNSTGVDITTEDEETMCVKMIASFFSKIGAKHVAEQTVKKLYNAGFDTLLKIIDADKTDFRNIDGFQAKLAERTYESIHTALQDVNLSDVLGASGIFGFGIGSRKVKALLLGFPDIFDVYHTITQKQLYNRIMEIEGYSDKTAQKIVSGIEWADKFVKALGQYATFKEQKKIDLSLGGQIIVFSGTRPERYPGLRDEIEGRGGKISTGVSGRTTILVVKDKNQLTGKMRDAEAKGTKIMSVEEFMDEYIKKTKNPDKNPKKKPKFERDQVTENSWIDSGVLPSNLLNVPFDSLWNLHPKEAGKVMMYGKLLDVPRWQKTYGKDYKFSGIVHKGEKIPKEFQQYLDWVNTLGYGEFNQVFVNWYKDGTHYIGKHRDSEHEIIKDSAIVSISFGETRIFRLRNYKTNEIVRDIKMTNGDVLVMGGKFQTELTHEVPKITGKNASLIGPRINLTFRQFTT